MAGEEGGGFYSAKIIADLLNITPQRLQQLARDGIVPKKNSAGLYDLRACVSGYVRFLQARTKGRAPTTDEVGESLKAERMRRVRMENDEREGLLVRIDEVRAAAATWMSIVVGMLDSIPGRLAAQLASESDPATVRAILKDDTRRAREAAARELEALAGPSDARGAAKAAPRKNARRVGRAKQGASSRKRRTRAVAK